MCNVRELFCYAKTWGLCTSNQICLRLLKEVPSRSGSVVEWSTFFMWLFHGSHQYWTIGFMFFVILCPGAPEVSTGSGSGLKHLRRWGHSLKSHPTDWETQGSNSGPLGPGEYSNFFLICRLGPDTYCLPAKKPWPKNGWYTVLFLLTQQVLINIMSMWPLNMKRAHCVFFWSNVLSFFNYDKNISQCI